MRIFEGIFLLASASTVLAAARQDPQDTHRGMDRDMSQERVGLITANRSDRILATWLLVENNNEVALAELAGQRAEDPAVKQFAQQMVVDHRRMALGMQPFAANIESPQSMGGDLGRLGGTQDPARTQDPEQTLGSPQEAGSRTRGADFPGQLHGELDHVALLEELGQQCLRSSRALLERKQGAEFDRCYIGMALGAHMKANDAMTVFQRHASDELSREISDSQSLVASHLEKAKQIAAKLEDGALQSSSSGSSKPSK